MRSAPQVWPLRQLRLPVALIALLAVGSSTVSVPAQAPEATVAEAPAVAPITTPPNVQIVVFFDPMMGHPATVVYRGKISRSQAKAELAELAARLGYESIDAVRPMVDGELQPLQYEVRPEGTAMTFQLSERAFNRDNGTFRLEPFIETYKNYGRIDIDIGVGAYQNKRFAYRGVGNYDNEHLRLRHSGRGTWHSFEVDVTDPSFTDLVLPPYALPTQLIQTPSAAERTTDVLIVAAWLLAGLGAVILLVAYGRRRRHNRRPGARPAMHPSRRQRASRRAQTRAQTRAQSRSGQPNRTASQVAPQSSDEAARISRPQREVQQPAPPEPPESPVKPRPTQAQQRRQQRSGERPRRTR